MEENSNSEEVRKNLPEPPKVEAPTVELRPEVKEFIDRFAEALPNMTAHEIQYFIQKTGLAPARQAKPKVLPTASRKKTVEPLPELRDWHEIMDGIEAYVTEGFEEPKAIVPLRQSEENPLLSMVLDKLGGFLDNISKNPKVQDSIASLLDAFAKKLTEAK